MNQSKPIHIAALTGGQNTPSTRFRIRQHITRLKTYGIEVREHLPVFGKSCGLPSPFKAAARIPAIFETRNADVVWLNKLLVQGYETFERLLKRPRVLDVDDAIWLNLPFGKIAAPHIAKGMDTIIAGNEYLADYFDKYCKDIHIVPTAIDLDRFKVRGLPEFEPEKFVIGWTGLACNYKFIKPILPALHRFMTDHKRAEMLLISNKPWKQKLLPPEKIRYTQWTVENETILLHEMSVGIMPLTDDKWTRGKCSFKMLQYMASGIPVIASPVGMNAQVFEKGEIGFPAMTNDQWYDALKTLYENWSLQQQMGQTGRNIVEKFYNTDTVAKQLAEILRQTATN